MIHETNMGNQMESFFLNAFGEVFNSLASMSTVLTYLGFVYAAFGLANTSRSRWEDICFSSLDTELKKNAAEQASRDFHNWYASIILLSNVGEVLAVLSWTYLIASGSWEKVIWLSMATGAFISGHIFCYVSYRREAIDVLKERKTYSPFFPLSMFLARKPQQSIPLPHTTA